MLFATVPARPADPENPAHHFLPAPISRKSAYQRGSRLISALWNECRSLPLSRRENRRFTKLAGDETREFVSYKVVSLSTAATRKRKATRNGREQVRLATRKPHRETRALPRGTAERVKEGIEQTKSARLEAMLALFIDSLGISN